MKNGIVKIVIIVCLIVTILDQSSKFLVMKFASDGFGTENFGFVITKNTGMAFGFNQGNAKNIFLTIFVLLILIIFLKNQNKELDVKTTVAISISIGGGFSNLLDRFFRGGVLDFISIWKFPNFNVADICVCTGWILIIVYLIVYSNNKDIIKSTEKEDEK